MLIKDLIFSVVPVTTNDQDAKLILEMCLKGLTEGEKKEIIEELGKIDLRFIDWNAKYVFTYLPKNLNNNDSLYLSAKVAKLIRTGKYKITLILEEMV